MTDLNAQWNAARQGVHTALHNLEEAREAASRAEATLRQARRHKREVEATAYGCRVTLNPWPLANHPLGTVVK